MGKVTLTLLLFALVTISTNATFTFSNKEFKKIGGGVLSFPSSKSHNSFSSKTKKSDKDNRSKCVINSEKRCRREQALMWSNGGSEQFKGCVAQEVKVCEAMVGHNRVIGGGCLSQRTIYERREEMVCFDKRFPDTCFVFTYGYPRVICETK